MNQPLAHTLIPNPKPALAAIGSIAEARKTGLPADIAALVALIGERSGGSLGLRFLAPHPSFANPNQSNPSNQLGSARPFVPSSPSPKPRLRAQRIGGFIVRPVGGGLHSSPNLGHRDEPLPRGESAHPFPPFSRSGRTDDPASRRHKTSIFYASHRDGQTDAHQFPGWNSWSSRRHPARRHTLQSGSPCRSHRPEILPPEIGSKRPAFPSKTPSTLGLFNLSHASGSLPVSLISDIRPGSDVIGHSDSPGGRITARFLRRKKSRSPRVRHAANQSESFKSLNT